MMDTNLTYRNPDYDYLNNIAAGMGQGNAETPINETHPKKQRNKKRNKSQNKRGGRLIATAICCSLIGGAAGAGGYAVCSKNFGNDTKIEKEADNTTTIYHGQRESTAINTALIDTNSEMSQSEIYAANVNSTVGITTEVTTNYFGYQTTAAASGSGFILTEDGYIVTNYHVVNDAESIKVTGYDGTEYDAELVGYDESSDLAVLKVDASGLKPVVLGDSDQMNVGDSVVAIGNPLGELTFSLTSGSVSALDRDVTIEKKAMTLIQTDCAINSGNSGGALFNTHGEVVGITNAKYSGNGMSASVDNIGFAIPINSVKDTIKSIIEDGFVEKPYIGITGQDLSDEFKMYGLTGVAVTGVEEGGPADEAGLEANDIITKIDDKSVSSMSELKNVITSKAEGDTVKLSVYRQGEIIELDVKVKMHEQSTLPETNDQGK